MAEEFEERTTALIVLLPADDDPVTEASSEDIAHMTFVWFGDTEIDEMHLDSLITQVGDFAAETTPITVPVTELGELGDDAAQVAFLELTDALTALRDGLMEKPDVRGFHDSVEQYPNWTPHVTLGYPEAPPLAEYAGEQITFDRFALWVGNDRQEFPMGKTAITASAAVDLDVEDPTTEVPEDVDMDDEDFVDEPLIEIPVHGVATIEGKETGDGRMFALGSLTNRPLPLPIRYEFVGTHGGETSDVAPVGRIDEIWKVEVDGYTELRYRGVLITTKAYANEAIEGIADGSLTGVSVETDDWTIDVSEERERVRAMLLEERKQAEETNEASDAADVELRPVLDDDEIDKMVDQWVGDGSLSITTFSSARVCGFTIVPIPAFHEGYIALGPAFEDELGDEDREALVACGCGAGGGDEGGSSVREQALSAIAEGFGIPLDVLTASAASSEFPLDTELTSAEGVSVRFSLRRAHQLDPHAAAVMRSEGHLFAPGTKDGPGWITHPRATARIRRYWVKGKGAAKIRWGAPGDFNRCRTQLAKYVQNPDWLAGLCANMHKEALGIWPAQHHSVRQEALVASGAARAPIFTLTEAQPALVAGAGFADEYPAEWFANPELDKPTPITFTKDGRVFGHIAEWNSCHIGMDGVCMNPPHSIHDYAHFQKGVIDTDQGPVRVGTLTYGTRHASIRVDAARATAHYDNPDAVRAYVAVGEDVFGIWFAGIVRPTATRDQIAEFKALGAISGDWRWLGNDLELIAATAVNAPGYQIERQPIVAAANGHQTVLIAPPVVASAAIAEKAAPDAPTPLTVATAAAIARTAAQEVLAQQRTDARNAERVARVRAVRDQALASKIAAVRTFASKGV